jgi:hypothetical protein
VHGCGCEGPRADKVQRCLRAFCGLFVQPLVFFYRIEGDESRHKTTVLPLYYFVPLPFRGSLDIFISHGWDSWLRHLLFFPKESQPEKSKKERTCLNLDTCLWIDHFSIVQDPGSISQEVEVAGICDVVRTIGSTCLIVPGQGTPQFALLPARRSWCCLEIAFTPEANLFARVGVHRSFFQGHHVEAFHETLVAAVEQLDCALAETLSSIEQQSIRDILDREVGLETANGMNCQESHFTSPTRTVPRKKSCHSLWQRHGKARTTTATISY